MTRSDANPCAALWDELRALLRVTLQIFGDPRTLLEDRVLPRAEARRLASWIASLEAAARALLVALAASLPKPAPAHRRGADPQGAPAAADAASSPETPPTEPGAPIAGDACSPDDAPPEIPAPEAWAGVAFRFAPRASRGGGAGGAPGARRILSVRRLAYRLEALVRVATSPEPYARRLARRLVVDPGLASRALSRPDRRASHPPPYEDLVDDAFALAQGVVKAPETG